jgi:hypothetical protein
LALFRKEYAHENRPKKQEETAVFNTVNNARAKKPQMHRIFILLNKNALFFIQCIEYGFFGTAESRDLDAKCLCGFQKSPQKSGAYVIPLIYSRSEIAFRNQSRN